LLSDGGGVLLDLPPALVRLSLPLIVQVESDAAGELEWQVSVDSTRPGS
jgi:hypothetical protein